MTRRFLAKARGYMLTYQYSNKIHKMYRGHRDINCIDEDFIERVMSMSIKGNRDHNLIQNHTKSTGDPHEAPP